MPACDCSMCGSPGAHKKYEQPGTSRHMKKQQVYKTVQQLFANLLNHAPYICALKSLLLLE